MVAMGIYDNNRFMHAVMSIVGCNVNVFMKNGQILQGIFTSISPELDIALELVHSVSSDAEDELPVKGEVISNMVLKAYNIVSVTTMADMNAVCISSFATDGEIAKQNGDVTEKRLEQWESETLEEDHELEVNKYEVGWSAEDMFKRNEEQFGLASDFVDDLTQYNNVDVPANKESPEYLAKLAEAERLALLIEKNPTSKRALELENNDEERDIVDRQATYTSSALSASNSTQPSGNARAFSSNRRRGNNNGVSIDRRGGPHRGQSSASYNAAGLNTHQQRGNYRMHRDTDTGAPQSTGYGMVFSAKGNQAGGIGLKQQSLPMTTSVAISATDIDRRAQNYRRQDVRGGNSDGLQSVGSGNARRSANPPHGKGAYKERDRLPDLKRFGQEFHLSDNRGGMVRSSQQQQTRQESHAPASVSQPASSPTIQQSCLQQRPQQQLVSKPGNFYHSRLVLKRSSHVYKENTEQGIVIDRSVPKSSTSPVKTEATSTTDSGPNDNGKSADVDSSSSPAFESKLNPDAEEFRPQQFHQQTILLQPQQIARPVNFAGNGYYQMPTIVNAPPAAALAAPGVVQPLYQQQQQQQQQQPVAPQPTGFSVQYFHGNPPLYNIHTSQAPVAILQSSANLRQNINGATAQHTASAPHVLAGPVANQAAAQQLQQGSYVLQYGAPVPANGGQGPSANPALFLGQTRVLHPSYMMSQSNAAGEQHMYAMPQLVSFAPQIPSGQTPAAGVAQNLPPAQGIQQSSHMPSTYNNGTTSEQPQNQLPVSCSTVQQQQQQQQQPPQQVVASQSTQLYQQPTAGNPAYSIPNAPQYFHPQMVFFHNGAGYVTAPSGSQLQMFAGTGQGVAATAAAAVNPSNPSQLIPYNATSNGNVYNPSQGPYVPTESPTFLQFAPTGTQITPNAYHTALIRSASVPAYAQQQTAPLQAPVIPSAQVSANGNNP